MLSFQKPSGIAVASQSRSSDSPTNDGGQTYWSSERVQNAIADGAACASSFLSIMDAELVLAGSGPLWAVMELTTAAMGAAACPVMIGIDLLGSDDTMNQMQNASSLMTPAGQVGAVLGAIASGSDGMQSVADSGSLAADALMFVNDFTKASSIKDIGQLTLDGVSLSNEAYSYFNDFPLDAPSNDGQADDAGDDEIDQSENPAPDPVYSSPGGDDEDDSGGYDDGDYGDGGDYGGGGDFGDEEHFNERLASLPVGRSEASGRKVIIVVL